MSILFPTKPVCLLLLVLSQVISQHHAQPCHEDGDCAVKTVDKVAEAIAGIVARMIVKTPDKDKDTVAGMVAMETIKKPDVIEEIIAVYQPYKKLAR